jgi:hypothetical protein
LVDRGQGELVIDLLNKRERDRIKEDQKRKNAIDKDDNE